jgi:hypothetical protein
MASAWEKGVARLIEKGGPTYSATAKTTYIDRYAVLLDSGVRPSPSTVTGVPEIGDELEGISGRYCTEVAWRQQDPQSQVWIATVTYSPGEGQVVGGNTIVDFDFRWAIRSVMADFTQDAITGAPVCNSAGEPFDSVPQREIICPSLSWRRLSKIAPSTWADYNGTVNEDEVTILGYTFPPHCARFRYEARQLDDSDGTGKRYEYSMMIDGATNPWVEYASVDGTSVAEQEDIGWDFGPLDAGYSYLDYDESPPVVRPILIDDGDGKLIKPSMPQPISGGTWVPERGNLYFLRFSPYKEASWTTLKLPGDSPSSSSSSSSAGT